MRLLFLFILIMFPGLVGCMGPASLHKAVLSYDETISQLEREMLLINIARTHRGIPGHFTVTSSIAATFDYQTNIRMEGSFVERVTGGVNRYLMSIGASAAEKPTISIIPIQGEDFTKRVLTPMDESKFQFLVFQGARIDMLLRLMARGIVIQNKNGMFERFILNWPTRTEEYEEFRKRVLHLAWLNSNRNLFVGRLYFDKSITSKLPGSLSTNDLTNALEKDYHWQQVGEDGIYELTKPAVGRVAITNYDPKTLSNSERQALNDLAAANPNNIVLIDIRPEFPGGEYPMFGGIKLRSFNEILEFVASSIEKFPEYEVAPYPGTGKITPNPTKALSILVDAPVQREVFRVTYKGHDYSIGNTDWDNVAMKHFYQLFQMTVTDVTGVGAPLITISK